MKKNPRTILRNLRACNQRKRRLKNLYRTTSKHHHPAVGPFESISEDSKSSHIAVDPKMESHFVPLEDDKKPTDPPHSKPDNVNAPKSPKDKDVVTDLCGNHLLEESAEHTL